MIARFFIAIGAPLVAFVRYLGEVVLLAADTFRSAGRGQEQSPDP